MKVKIGFIGLGVMGTSMARNLLKADYSVTVFTRTKVKAVHILEEGAEWAETPNQVVEVADVVITMLGFPTDVREIYLSENGLIPNGRRGQVFIDMTTSEPALAKKLYTEGEKYGIHIVDAPVSGGDIGARKGTLSIMVGGEEEVFRQILPILTEMGEKIIYQGSAGAGQHTKMCNQIAICTNMIGVCEALVYGNKAGLDLDRVLESISTGAAGSWSLSNLAPRILNQDFEPGFYIKHFLKDLRIALYEIKMMDIELPGLSLAIELYEDLSNQGEENSGTQALYKFWGKE
ncbi:NAD(P)-dependent oxidoreductase [Bacillus sp. 2205SS5-2]|uniref:NAD(P)-dependent oxidoreductase n=1 Tax=Bacillus sp. 2205SS5-2 TaxID=3109031 RepID=UPI003003C2D5